MHSHRVEILDDNKNNVFNVYKMMALSALTASLLVDRIPSSRERSLDQDFMHPDSLCRAPEFLRLPGL